MQFYQLGFFSPQMAEQSLLCLQMMDFDGKDKIMQGIQRNAIMQQQLMFYLQAAANTSADPRVRAQAQMDMQAMGIAEPMVPVQAQGGSGKRVEADSTGGLKQEPTIVKSARERAANAPQA